MRAVDARRSARPAADTLDGPWRPRTADVLAYAAALAPQPHPPDWPAVSSSHGLPATAGGMVGAGVVVWHDPRCSK